MSELVSPRRAMAAILAAGLRDFVDTFDLLLLSVLRVSSLKELNADPFEAGLAWSVRHELRAVSRAATIDAPLTAHVTRH
jgi:hypothetical protein